MTFWSLPRVARPTPFFVRPRSSREIAGASWTLLTSVLTTAAFVAIAVIAFSMWQFDDSVIPWDSKNQFYAFFRFLGDALRNGSLPLWNPYHFGGYPAIADPQSLLTTPSLLLFAAIAPNASMPAFDAFVFAHLVLGGCGMLGLARRWRWEPSAGLLTALVFMLGGAASGRLQHTGMIISYSWFPLALWSLHAALGRRSLGLAIVAGLLTGLMALGRDQVAYLFCLVLAGEVIRQALRSDDGIDYLLRRLMVLACAGLTTVAVTIVPILLTLQFVHGSNRPGITYGMALEGSLDPINLLTLFAPNVFGSLDRIFDYWGPGAATAAGNDWTDPSIDYLFAGTLPIVLIVWHGLAGRRLVQRGGRFIALLFAAAAVYALGRHTPVFGLIFDWLPGVSLYRRPADASFVMNVALALGSGFLLHRYIVEGHPGLAGGGPLRWFAPAVTVALLAVLVGSGLTFARHAENLQGSTEALSIAAGTIAVVVLALLVFRSPARRGAVAIVLVLATGAQLIWHNSDSALNSEPISKYSAVGKLYPDEARGLAVLQAELARREQAGEHPRVEILGLDAAWQNASMVYKLPDTIGYNPLRMADYARMVGVTESANDPKLREFPDTFRGYNSRLALLLGLDYLLIDRPIADLPRGMPRPRATLIFSGVQFFLYRLENQSVPRVTLATTIKPTDSERAIADGILPAFDPISETLVDDKDITKLSDATLRGTVTAAVNTTASTPSSARILDYADNRVTINVEAAKAGVLVLHDLYYPGWQVTVDGRPMPLLRTDLLFRGVEVPLGHHIVEFSFHPFSMHNLVAAAGSLFSARRE